MPVLRAAGLLLFAASLPACGGLGDEILGAEPAPEVAHAVFMTRPDCPYFVTNQTRNQFAVLTPRDGFAPRQGDLLVGILRDGVLPLEVVPFGDQGIARTLTFEVAGHDLSLAEAQDLYYSACPLPSDTTGVR